MGIEITRDLKTMLLWSVHCAVKIWKFRVLKLIIFDHFYGFLLVLFKNITFFTGFWGIPDIIRGFPFYNLSLPTDLHDLAVFCLHVHHTFLSPGPVQFSHLQENPESVANPHQRYKVRHFLPSDRSIRMSINFEKFASYIRHCWKTYYHWNSSQ